ncbi:hypothetical protein BST96_11840 [Oceanicoccus sagamiensis]|uniref:Nitrogen fixation protein FixH n=2 Tax=Oceanicoccus sagamiensis TaxID=716816 RepID=A0A1X9N9I5_9GAMM|nr:hypothetical protein BST96_11840 [Oceanicoccus sagamiensis]
MNTKPTDIVVEPWYKQFWPWFIFLLPASVVVAGVITVIIAFRNADSLVADDYYKKGLGINQTLAEDTAASDLAAKAHIDIDALTGEVRVKLLGEFSVPPTDLVLEWIHPTSQKQDFAMAMNITPTAEYGGQLQSAVSGRWYLELSSQQPVAWRLKSEIDLGAPTSDNSERYQLLLSSGVEG